MFLLQCFSPGCLEARGVLPPEQRLTKNFCPHIVKSKEALQKKHFASFEIVNIREVLKKVPEQSLEEALLQESSDGEVVLYLLPDGNIAVPILDIFSCDKEGPFVHVRDSKCSMDACSKKVKSKKHCLVVKGIPKCAHYILGNSLLNFM